MTIPTAVREYLRRKGGHFSEQAVPATGNFAQAVAEARLPSEHVAQATVVTTGKAALMVIHAVSHEPDMDALQSMFHRRFGLCRRQDLERIFRDCDLQALPPLPEAFGMKAIVDASLAGAEEIYFAPGRAGVVVRASGEAFARLTEGAWQRPVAKRRREVACRHKAPQRDLREEMRLSRRIPAMPGIALEILKLRENPYSHVCELAAVVEQDSELAAQILSYASSGLFNHQGETESVELAIARALGMDFAMDFAFGLSLAKSFRQHASALPDPDGFWRHAIYTATLCQTLSERIPFMQRPSPGVAYLSGLMHDFGLPLLGELFPAPFERIHRAVARQPGRPLMEIEHELLGLTRRDVGIWLMEDWGMPREILEAVSHHHDPDFRGDFSAYANLVHIAVTLLKREGIGDAEVVHLAPGALAAVGLDEVQVESALAEVMECRDSLDVMARKMGGTR